MARIRPGAPIDPPALVIDNAPHINHRRLPVQSLSPPGLRQITGVPFA